MTDPEAELSMLIEAIEKTFRLLDIDPASLEEALQSLDFEIEPLELEPIQQLELEPIEPLELEPIDIDLVKSGQ